jgi:hypothetical protein
MIEIAFCLAIVAFALVAIMGVLPTGMTVQRDNREDTIVNNDANFWLESLRSGSRGLNDLTNYVDAIIITNTSGQVRIYNNTFAADSQIVSGEQIVGLLLTPKYTNNGATRVTNTVIARVRAINGPAIEKGNPLNEFTFRYEFRPELVSLSPTPDGEASYFDWSNAESKNVGVHDVNVMSNWHHLRLTFRWPLFQQGTNWGVGRNRRTVRTAVSGQMVMRQAETLPVNNFLNFVEPNVYTYVPQNP